MTGASRATSARVRAELLLFSGRPNPSWELAPEEVDELARRLGRLPAAPGSGRAPDHAAALGYRGVALLNVGPVSAEAPARIHVYNGLVHVTDGRDTTLRDDGALLERWLLDLARAHDFGGLVDQIAAGGGAGA